MNRITELRAEGLTNRQVAKRLNEEGLLTPTGKPWTLAAIQNHLYRYPLRAAIKREQIEPYNREKCLKAWGRRRGFNDPYGVRG